MAESEQITCTTLPRHRPDSRTGLRFSPRALEVPFLKWGKAVKVAFSHYQNGYHIWIPYMDIYGYIHMWIFQSFLGIHLCQTKPSWSLAKISNIINIHYPCKRAGSKIHHKNYEDVPCHSLHIASHSRIVQLVLFPIWYICITMFTLTSWSYCSCSCLLLIVNIS